VMGCRMEVMGDGRGGDDDDFLLKVTLDNRGDG
jgi:hypothetical protein